MGVVSEQRLVRSLVLQNDLVDPVPAVRRDIRSLLDDRGFRARTCASAAFVVTSCVMYAAHPLFPGLLESLCPPFLSAKTPSPLLLPLLPFPSTVSPLSLLSTSSLSSTTTLSPSLTFPPPYPSPPPSSSLPSLTHPSSPSLSPLLPRARAPIYSPTPSPPTLPQSSSHIPHPPPPPFPLRTLPSSSEPAIPPHQSRLHGSVGGRAHPSAGAVRAAAPAAAELWPCR